MTALRQGNVVLTATTGSGKSTRVPVWCAALGRVLVIEPRRVACRSLAARVSETEVSPLGERIGYIVRDDVRATEHTGIVFVTPGIAIQMLRADPTLGAYQTVIIDEFHERTLDIDLICSALKASERSGVIIMSATIDGPRIAEYLGGRHIECKGKAYPVSQTYIDRSASLPDAKALGPRILATVDTICRCEGNVLIFLPGKYEISQSLATLRGSRELDTFEFIILHGGLSIQEQGRVFSRGDRRRIILCTNVAETSLTVPGVRLVIDSGLVRQTQYRSGRGFLTLKAIADDSAAQRSGRAGRLAKGHCVRLWGSAAKLAERTLPEIRRESLVPFVFGCAALGIVPSNARVLDLPPKHAIETAESELRALGALTAKGTLTAAGRLMQGLPLDIALGGMLVAARKYECLVDMIYLVAGLAVGRPLFLSVASHDERQEGLKGAQCDALALIKAVRGGVASRDGLSEAGLREARLYAKRLFRAFQLPREQAIKKHPPVDRKRLGQALMASDRRSAYVSRKRKRETTWSNGGTEVSLSKQSAVSYGSAEPGHRLPETLLALETRAIAEGPLRGKVIITSAMPVPKQWLVDAEIGRVKIHDVRKKNGALVVEKHRVHAGKNLHSWTEIPKGKDAMDSVVLAITQGRVWPKLMPALTGRLERWAILSQLEKGLPHPILDPADYLASQAAALGIECGSDLALLEPSDFLPGDIPQRFHGKMARQFPSSLDYADVTYRVGYDIPRKKVFLYQVGGSRRNPPPLGWLPKFAGLSIVLVDKRGEHTIRGRSG